MTEIAAFAALIGIFAAFAGIYRLVIAHGDKKEKQSIDEFRRARKLAKECRSMLHKRALQTRPTSPPNFRTSKTIPLFFQESWIPKQPIILDNIDLMLEPDPGFLIKLRHDLLPTCAGKRYERFSEAVAQLDKPVLFENRIQYRILGVTDSKLSFSESEYHYFDKIDYGEYFVHELAIGALRKIDRRWRGNRKAAIKRFHRLSDHVVLAGVNTLTIICSEDEPRIIMHLRGKDETGTAMGAINVVPAAEFQPSCLAPTSFKEDLNLWKNIMREYAEELLCMDEYDGNNTVPFDYKSQPYSILDAGKMANKIRPYYLGFGIDPITLQGQILTAVVFGEEIFNSIFMTPRLENREGKIFTESDRWGRPFTLNECNAYRNSNILPAGEATLNIAWEHRDLLTSCLD